MQEKTVTLCVPAEPGFARSVRMMAANLAVVCDMSVDDVDDVRMAAEEAFVFACATEPQTCNITFQLSDSQLTMTFLLGEGGEEPDEETAESLDLAELLLSAVCDEYQVSPDGTSLRVTKRLGASDAQ